MKFRIRSGAGYVERIPKDRLWTPVDGVPMTSDKSEAHIFDEYEGAFNLALTMDGLGYVVAVEVVLQEFSDAMGVDYA